MLALKAGPIGALMISLSIGEIDALHLQRDAMEIFDPAFSPAYLYARIAIRSSCAQPEQAWEAEPLRDFPDPDLGQPARLYPSWEQRIHSALVKERGGFQTHFAPGWI